MKKNYKLFLILIGLLIFGSCADEKKLLYFQKTPNSPDTLSVSSAYIPKIQPGDLLSITVTSLSPEASSFFNPFSNSGSTGSGAASGNAGSSIVGQAPATGFLVDVHGNIELPIVGTTSVMGLTTIEAMNLIKGKVKEYLKEPTVVVRFLNYRISITGEVTRPSVYVIPNEMITLPEALAMAGDLTAFGNRSNILIVRDVNGKKEFGNVNLSGRDVYNSPYYYLHNNDLVYVQPTRVKAQQTDKSFQFLTIAVSVASLIVLIFRR